MVGALISIAAPTMAQEAEYTQQLNAVSQALKDKAPGAEKMAKSFISDYKKNAPAILALGSSFLTVRNFAKADEMADLVLSRNKKNEKVQAEAYILKGDIEAVKDQAGNGGKFFKVSGKTGTAQFSENGSYAGRKYMVSFCGYFPSDDPKYSCIVCIRKKGLPASGGGQCGPVFSEISQFIMSRDSMQNAALAADTNSVFVPEVTKGDVRRAKAIVEGMGLSKKQLDLIDADTVPLNKVPDVIGMGVKDAVYVLQQRGLRVRINGCGEITKQDIPAGSVAVKGNHITLTASSKN